MLVVALPRFEVMGVKAAVLDVALQLIGIGSALAVALAVGTPEAGQGSDARRALVIDDVVGIAAGVFRCAVLIDEAWQFQPRAEIDQHGLEAAHVAIGLHHRLADESAAASGSEIGRSSIEMQSQRSR